MTTNTTETAVAKKYWGNGSITPKSYSAKTINSVLKDGVGASDWIASAGGKSKYYFNIDKIFK